MPRYLPLDTVKRLAIRALQSGARQRITRDDKVMLHHVLWDVAGNCNSPVTVEVHGRPYRDRPRPARGRLWFVELQTRCRKCENCLASKSSHWRLRAVSEYGQSKRSWLVTLTFKPEEQFRLLSIARRKIDKQGINFDALLAAEKFRLHAAESGRMVTLYLKRLRKAGCTLRYLAVCEAHASGMPHWHLVLHEPGSAIPHRTLKTLWPHGFLDAKLIEDTRQATYVCKYVSKSPMARVRASLRYGMGAS